MSTFTDLFISEAEALSGKLIAEGEARLNSATARLAGCDKRVKKVEGIHHGDQERFHKAEVAFEKHNVSVIAPHILAAYEKLPSIELKLKVAAYEHQRKTDEYKRLQTKHIDAIESEICFKKSNKRLTQTVESLTAQLEGTTSPQEQALKDENQELRKELDLLKARLATKTEELEAKDVIIISKQQDIDHLREDFDAYQSVHEDIWSHRHDGCNELAAALDEQCSMITAERNILEANLNTLDHKCSSLAMERDYLQEKFDESIEAHKLELEDLDTSKCKDSQSGLPAVRPPHISHRRNSGPSARRPDHPRSDGGLGPASRTSDKDGPRALRLRRRLGGSATDTQCASYTCLTMI